MDVSRVQVNELMQLDASAWAALLRARFALPDLAVRAVTAEPLASGRLTRYLVAIDGGSDPVPFIAKKTNRVEAQFYRDIAPIVPRLLPRCLLRHHSQDWSWVVLDDVPEHYPAVSWTDEDVEKVVTMLASFHGAFWHQADRHARLDWLQQPLAAEDLHQTTASQYGDAPWQTALSRQALRASGVLAHTFAEAAAGVEVLRRLGGWPGVVSRRHLDTVAELLDDPLPLLQTLRDLPATVLHGDPAPRHWRLTLFQDRKLLDWSRVNVGPPVLDLVAFLEQYALFCEQTGTSLGCLVSEETIVDSYLLRMHVALPGFSAREMRLAIPAARCLYLLTHWLPRLADWFAPFVGSPLTWQSLVAMDDHELRRVGYRRMAGVRGYVAGLFRRVSQDARQL